MVTVVALAVVPSPRRNGRDTRPATARKGARGPIVLKVGVLSAVEQTDT